MIPFKRVKPIRASGAQIGVRRKFVIACPSCHKVYGPQDKKNSCLACHTPLVTFDSAGEFKCYLILKNAERAKQISNLQRQVRMELTTSSGEKVGHLVLDFTYDDSDGNRVYTDYKGKAMTELAAWKCKHFKAQYGREVILLGN